mmetsp:Transcript_6892/g.21531  ORF Transcript_6892/g.21531 Transcript_6892/m.21531 type:complete len:208 (+) Transcript_6892:713-1336(+)
MSSFSVSMDFSFFSIFSVSSFWRSSQAFFSSSHSSCTLSLLSVASLSRSSRVLMISPEWNLYSASSGSMPFWMKAQTAFCLAASTTLSASASARLSFTAWPSSRKAPGFAAFSASSALRTELAAFTRSGMAASNSVIFFRQRALFSSSSAESFSCFFFRSARSLSFVAVVAMFSSMSTDRLSISSWAFVTDSDLDLVVSLQKHANSS